MQDVEAAPSAASDHKGFDSGNSTRIPSTVDGASRRSSAQPADVGAGGATETEALDVELHTLACKVATEDMVRHTEAAPPHTLLDLHVEHNSLDITRLVP